MSWYCLKNEEEEEKEEGEGRERGGKKMERGREPGITWSMFFQRHEGERERETSANREDNTMKGGGVQTSKAESMESKGLGEFVDERRASCLRCIF